MSLDAFESEIKTEFLIEAKDLLSSVEQCFLDLEKNPECNKVLNNIFRLAHNLKGSSGAVGFAELADFTHKLESLLLALKEGRIAVTKDIVDLLLRSNDYLVATIDCLQKDMTATYFNAELSDLLCNAMTGTLNTESSSLPGPTDIEVRVLPTESKARETFAVPGSVEIPLSLIETSTPVQNKVKDENIRVSLVRIEQLLNNVGELSILQAVMVQQSFERDTVISSLMRETLSSMSKIVKDTQSLSMGLRMLPIKQTFQKMQRIVRDTSQTLGKDVELQLVGEETEIDKTVLEQLSDPLVHIIRNAVDHGLEDSGARMNLGKPGTGCIRLSAFHRAGHVVIEVNDDGKGLDAAKLIQKAKDKGILSSDALISNEQAYQLIFAPGFSTKEVVTDVSGRGVGMDVVKTNIKALQGQIEIETELGKGTCFRILLPLTLAIVDSVVVRSGSERYVIPLAQISEFFRPQPSEINFIYGRPELLTLREEHLAIFHLPTLLGRDSATSAAEKEASLLTALIVTDGRTTKYAVMVDQVLSQQQVVIKPLGNEVKGHCGLMGSAILGDGKPALILDLFEITKKARGSDKQKKKTEINKRETA